MLLFEKPDWETGFDRFHSAWRTDVLWSVIDLAKEGKYLPQAMRVAELFSEDPDPSVEDPTNQEVLRGEEVKPILTVRGTVAWLIGVIAGRLNTDYYPRAIDVLEKLCSDPAVYVRQMATYPLLSFMVNIKAEKNSDGTTFNFLPTDKERVMGLAFSMLEANRQYPRVMEVLINVFERMRFLSEKEAYYVLNSFLYDDKGNFLPDYVTHTTAPLLIFFAEFVTDHRPEFNKQEFQSLLKKVIITSPVNLKTTLAWHFWKTIENDSKSYVRLKEYIPFFFEGEFEQWPLSQYEFLIERILPQSPTEAIWVFKQEIKYIQKGLAKKLPNENEWTLWFHNPESIIDAVAEHEPQSLVEILLVLTQISLRNGYIGNIFKIFSSYQKAPEELRENLKEQLVPLYESLRQKHHYQELPAL